jgi:hypothetical protein
MILYNKNETLSWNPTKHSSTPWFVFKECYRDFPIRGFHIKHPKTFINFSKEKK